jgi:hypothetical protein
MLPHNSQLQCFTYDDYVGALLTMFTLVRVQELTGQTLMINTPGLFKFGWALMSVTMDERTKKKYAFLGKRDLHRLKEYLPVEIIPEHLGGAQKERVLTGKDGMLYRIVANTVTRAYIASWLSVRMGCQYLASRLLLAHACAHRHTLTCTYTHREREREEAEIHLFHPPR